MNVEYTHVGNQAIIIDENGDTRIIPYYDNLEDVLMHENLIEEIEKEYKKTIETKEYLNKRSKYYIPYCTPLVILFTYFGVVSICKLSGLPEEELNTIIHSKLGNITYIDLIRILTLILGMPMGVLVDLLDFNRFKNAKKQSNAIDAKLEYLKKELIESKEKLEELKQNKKNTNLQDESKYEIKNIDDLYIKALNNLMKFYYELGYDEKKLYKSYLKGKLNTSYEDYSLELATKYFEEKGPILTKKYKK